MAILIECGNERTVDSSASGRRSKCPLEPRLTMRGAFLLIEFPRTTTTWRAPSRCVAGKRTWGTLTLTLTHLCTHAHNVYILEKIFLFESQLTGLAAQQNCFCSVYFAVFIVVRHPLWSPARPVFLSKGPLHAPQLTAGFVPGAIDDCWYTSFVVSTDNRQATGDGRQLSNFLSVLAGSRQLVRICPKSWSDNNGVMCARGLLAGRPAAPICWLNWAWAWVRRARLKWGALENLHIIKVKQLRRHRESQWINCCLCFLDCKISIVMFSFWFSLGFASSSFRLWWSHHRIKRNVATQRASEMDLAYLVLPSYVYQHFHFISPNWKCYFTNNNGTIWNTSGFLLELWMSQMNAESELVSSYSLSPLLTLPDLAIFSVNKCQYLYLVYLKLTVTTAVR